MATANELRAERDALQAFKAYCHERMDGAGIPTHPEGPHSAAGCRIGDRFDLLIGQRDQLAAENARLREEYKRAVAALGMHTSYGCPACSGDCASANPPVMCCPTQSAISVFRSFDATFTSAGKETLNDA
jgi:hypothetical protein